MFDNPDEIPPMLESEEDTELADEEIIADSNHHHGPDCGHEAVEHGDHVDYVHDDGHHHFLKGGRWHRHRSKDDR
jgi:hypothetical protein